MKNENNKIDQITSKFLLAIKNNNLHFYFIIKTLKQKMLLCIIYNLFYL